MEYRILGPLEVAETDRLVALGRGRQRSVLALLLLHANEVVPSERLIDELWGESPPPTASKSVQVYVSQLRKALRNGDPEGPLLTRGRGYVLKVEPGELDLERFEEALAEGRRALDAAAPEQAADALRGGLALWRGAPLADFAYEPFAQAEIARLEDLRLAATEERIEADLELGRQADVVGELEGLVAAHPLRERLRGQLMIALYRCHRQAEALDVYREGRQRLVEELGIEPSSSLRYLHEQMLAQDPALGAPARLPRPPIPRGLPAVIARRPRALVLAGVALLAAALGVAGVQALSGEPAPRPPAVPLTFSALAAVEPESGAVESALALPGVGRLAVEGSRVWVGADDSGTVSAVDSRSRQLVRQVSTELFPSDIAAGEGLVWVVDGSRGRVARIDPSYGRLLGTVPFTPSGEAPADRFGFEPTSIAVGAGAAWITDGSRRLLRIDRDGGREAIRVGRPLVGVAFGAGGVWTISGETAEVFRVDPRTNEVDARLQLVGSVELESAYPIAIAAAGQYVWVLNGNTGVVTKVDSPTRSVLDTVKVGVDRGPVHLAADANAVWVANEDGTLARIDVATSDLTFFEVGRTLRDVGLGAGAVWATNRLADCCGQEE